MRASAFYRKRIPYIANNGHSNSTYYCQKWQLCAFSFLWGTEHPILPIMAILPLPFIAKSGNYVPSATHREQNTLYCQKWQFKSCQKWQNLNQPMISKSGNYVPSATYREQNTLYCQNWQFKLNQLLPKVAIMRASATPIGNWYSKNCHVWQFLLTPRLPKMAPRLPKMAFEHTWLYTSHKSKLNQSRNLSGCRLFLFPLRIARGV